MASDGPENEIEKYSTYLRPDGVLYITTPNFNSISRRLLGKKWNVIHYPEHLHYFTQKSIHNLLQKFNFSKITIQSSGFSPARLIYSFKSKNQITGKGLEHYDYNELDRQLRDNIEKTILLRLIKKAINYFLAKLRSGDSLKILYFKKG